KPLQQPEDEPKQAALVDDPEQGTLEGRITLVGELPKIEDFTERMSRHADKALLLKTPMEDRLDPTWRIDPKTRGVANVVVFIKRPADGKLPIQPQDKARKDPVVIDAPFGAFVPHMAAYYPEWLDGKDRGTTGQELIFKNSG